MRKVILTKVSGGGIGKNPFRGTDAIGSTDDLPTVGRTFSMLAPPIDPAMSFRVVETSIIKEVESIENGYRFKTLNSVYEAVFPKEA